MQITEFVLICTIKKLIYLSLLLQTSIKLRIIKRKNKVLVDITFTLEPDKG